MTQNQLKLNMSVLDLTGELVQHPTKMPKPRALKSIKKVVVHTTDWKNLIPQELAKYDIGPNHISSTGCPTITYHFFIEQDGTVYQTADANIVTWHAALHNADSLAVCLNYKTDPVWERKPVGDAPPKPENTPSLEMYVALEKLLAEICLSLKLPPSAVVGHRELPGTGFILAKGHKQLRKTCPGMSVNLDFLRTRVAAEMQKELKRHGLYTGDIDGLWGKRSSAALLALPDRVDLG